MSYGVTTIEAVKLANKNKISPIEAWHQSAVIAFPNSKSSQEKCCPKNAFLGLCETGKIEGVPTGNYTRSDLNKKYALAALRILAEKKTITPLVLWKEVLTRLNGNLKKRHNSQMNVVIALWENGLIKP